MSVPLPSIAALLAKPGEPECGNNVGPVWKLDGETWICQRAEGHDDYGHLTSDGTWWDISVGRTPPTRTTDQPNTGDPT